MANSAVSAVARGVGDLATNEASFLCGVHDEVEFLREDLTTLQTFLSVAREAQCSGGGGDAIAADSVRRIRDVAYEAENIIDTADYREKRNSRRTGLLGAMSRYARKPRDLVVLDRLGKDILRVRRRIQEIKSSREVLDAIDAGGCVTARTQEPIAPRARLSCPVAKGNESVGFKRDVKKIVARLTDSGCPQLTVLSIVAMGGAGKTTLATKVYNSAAVREHFDAFAFVSISQQFEAHTVLKELTAQAMGIKRQDMEFDKSSQAEKLEKMGDQELAEMLHSFLERKRYLIVLDDVWRMDTWEAIQHAFPDQGNGSRVMLTTRNSQVAKQADKLTHVHKVRLLNEQESWKLFSLKAFPSYENIDANNRQMLESVGRSLSKKCHGLPLALVVLGSHLSKNLHLDTWSKMERCLDWEVTNKGKNIKQIIGRSYDNMSSPLKNCFLDIASFPEDFKIPAEDLTRRWIAESFVPHRPNQTLEDSAYDCLVELVQRSMVHIAKWDKFGQISFVRMHDILREWAIEQAREDGFLKVCKSRDDVRDRMSVYLLSFQNFFDNQFFTFATNLRSMLGFHLPSVTLDSPRFLRVVYIWNTNLEKVSKVLGRLVHLRYIGLLLCKNVVLPSSIGRLLNLQSIDLTGTPIPRVPKSLWDIPALRHVAIDRVEGSFNLAAIRVAEQNDLQTLYIYSTMVSTVKLGTSSTRWIRLKKYIMRMTQLRILILSCAWFLPVDILIDLKNHRHLHTLDFRAWDSMTAFPESGLLPQNLRFLALSFDGTWNTWHADLLPTLARLQSLVDLTLTAGYRQDEPDAQLTSQHCQEAGVPLYEAPIMSSPVGGFPLLRYLTLWGIQASKLRFQAGTMPKLVELRLVSSHMTTVPEGLLGLPSLEKLELLKMKNELPRETHELLETKGIKVVITKGD
ncbi:hypothetical protein EJB05_35403, partial [Eragrostis curvula]